MRPQEAGAEATGGRVTVTDHRGQAERGRKRDHGRQDGKNHRRRAQKPQEAA